MIPKLVDARYIKDYIICLTFSDGTKGKVDFKDELDGEIFEPLRDLGFFKKFIVNREISTIAWPNGADFAPEFLFEKLQVPV